MKYQSSKTKHIYEISFDTSRKYRSLCPECTKGRTKCKEKDLEYYPDTQRAYCFHCSTTMYEYKPFEPKKEYSVPKWKNITNLSDKTVKFFESRMINQETLIKMKVYSDIEWMPQFGKEMECICFPFFKNDQLVNIKFRAPLKKFKLVSNAELIWYNYDCIVRNSEIIICEGEIDALTFVQNGFDNVVSVPNGAKTNGEYLDNSIELFSNIQKIYLATDIDTVGLELKDELIRRFGADRCFSVNFKDCKDANQYLMKYGSFDFPDCIKEAKPIPVVGNIEISSLYDRILNLYENGLQSGKKVEIEEIDKYCTWELGRLCTVTGIPSSGKSEFVDYIVSLLNLKHGWKVAYFTPENHPLEYHYSKIHEKFSGYKFRRETDQTNFDTIYEHISNNFFYILNEEDFTVESIMRSAESYVKQKGVKVIVVDPYNQLDHQIKNNETETQYVSRFLSTLLKFAKKNNVLVFLVAHPTKVEAGKVPTLYNISGSAHFYNKTDYGFTVHRMRDENTNAMTNNVQVHWQKIKFKHLGKQGVSEFEYNLNNGRFDTSNNYDYTDWLNTTPINNIDYSTPLKPIPINDDFYQQPPEDAPF